MKKKSGISLITLIITIVIIVVLIGAIVLNISNNNPIKQAEKAITTSDIATLKEEYALSVINKMATNPMFKQANINAKNNSLGDESDIKTWIPSINDKYKDKLEIVDGEIVYVPGLDEKDKEIFEEAGLNEKIEYITTFMGIFNAFPELLMPDRGDDLKIKVTDLSTGKYKQLEYLDNKQLAITGTAEDIISIQLLERGAWKIIAKWKPILNENNKYMSCKYKLEIMADGYLTLESLISDGDIELDSRDLNANSYGYKGEVTYASVPFKFGDLNGDGIINDVDEEELALYAGSRWIDDSGNVIDEKKHIRKYDGNRDGRVNSQDLSIILNNSSR